MTKIRVANREVGNPFIMYSMFYLLLECQIHFHRTMVAAHNFSVDFCAFYLGFNSV